MPINGGCWLAFISQCYTFPHPPLLTPFIHFSQWTLIYSFIPWWLPPQIETAQSNENSLGSCCVTSLSKPSASQVMSFLLRRNVNWPETPAAAQWNQDFTENRQSCKFVPLCRSLTSQVSVAQYYFSASGVVFSRLDSVHSHGSFFSVAASELVAGESRRNGFKI